MWQEIATNLISNIQTPASVCLQQNKVPHQILEANTCS